MLDSSLSDGSKRSTPGCPHCAFRIFLIWFKVLAKALPHSAGAWPPASSLGMYSNLVLTIQCGVGTFQALLVGGWGLTQLIFPPLPARRGSSSWHEDHKASSHPLAWLRLPPDSPRLTTDGPAEEALLHKKWFWLGVLEVERCRWEGLGLIKHPCTSCSGEGCVQEAQKPELGLGLLVPVLGDS